MSGARKVQVPWAEVDTLLLDMDGTLLDLAFDNYFWLELVPEKYAELEGIEVDAAKREVVGRTEAIVGTLPWYCIDHWSLELGIDIRALKEAHSHLIRYLPGAEAFLAAARGRGKRLVLVTNAHRGTLAIKTAVTGVDRWMDRVVSSHDYRAPKESAAFWSELARREDVDPRTSLLVEDSVSVLATAKAFGLEHTIAVRRPDSRCERREVADFAAVDGVAELI